MATMEHHHATARAHGALLERLEQDEHGMWLCALRVDRMLVKTTGTSDEDALEGCLELIAAHFARGAGAPHAELGGEGGGWA